MGGGYTSREARTGRDSKTGCSRLPSSYCSARIFLAKAESIEEMTEDEATR